MRWKVTVDSPEADRAYVYEDVEAPDELGARRAGTCRAIGEDSSACVLPKRPVEPVERQVLLADDRHIGRVLAYAVAEPINDDEGGGDGEAGE